MGQVTRFSLEPLSCRSGKLLAPIEAGKLLVPIFRRSTPGRNSIRKLLAALL